MIRGLLRDCWSQKITFCQQHEEQTSKDHLWVLNLEDSGCWRGAGCLHALNAPPRFASPFRCWGHLAPVNGAAVYICAQISEDLFQFSPFRPGVGLLG